MTTLKTPSLTPAGGPSGMVSGQTGKTFHDLLLCFVSIALLEWEVESQRIQWEMDECLAVGAECFIQIQVQKWFLVSFE